MKIAVIGTGYVGLVAGACFANSGNRVTCVDKDPKKIQALKEGKIPIYEPGLDTLVLRGREGDRLSFTTDTEEAVQQSEIIFLAVGTPAQEDGSPNLSFLKSAVQDIAGAMTGYRVIVNKSTVPVGTQKAVTEWIEGATQQPFDVVSNPEFLKEGTAVDDFLKPDRVIIGTKSKKAYEKMAELYSPFVRSGNPIHWMDPTSAEITKYACNALLATKISFMNELSVLCEKVGGDIEKVRQGMTTDIRIGRHFLYPGVGYGGSCFPKDVKALVHTAKDCDVPLKIIEAAEDANARQKRHLVGRIKEHYGSDLSGKTFGVLGLAFKPRTDDVREAPAFTIIEELLKSGAQIKVFDPVAMDNSKEILGDRVTYCKSLTETVENSDGMVLVTEWSEFRQPEFELLKAKMKNPVIFDGRNIYQPDRLTEQGFKYYGIGRTLEA